MLVKPGLSDSQQNIVSSPAGAEISPASGMQKAGWPWLCSVVRSSVNAFVLIRSCAEHLEAQLTPPREEEGWMCEALGNFSSRDVVVAVCWSTLSAHLFGAFWWWWFEWVFFNFKHDSLQTLAPFLTRCGECVANRRLLGQPSFFWVLNSCYLWGLADPYISAECSSNLERCFGTYWTMKEMRGWCQRAEGIFAGWGGRHIRWERPRNVESKEQLSIVNNG